MIKINSLQKRKYDLDHKIENAETVLRELKYQRHLLDMEEEPNV